MNDLLELDALPCPLLITDLDGKLIFINQNALTEFGDLHDEVTDLEHLFPKASQIFLHTHLWPQLRREGFLREIYVKILDKQNQPLSVLINATKGQFQEQACYRWVILPALQRAIFEQELLKTRKQNQEYAIEVNATKRRLRRILDTAEDIAIITLDEQGVIQFSNTGASKLFGYSEMFLTGKSFQQFFAASVSAKAGLLSLKEQLDLLTDKTAATAISTEFETQLVHLSGQSIDVLLQLRFFDAQASAHKPELLLLATDIGKRKQFERLQNEFVATISHEFRTPLTSLLGSLTLLKNKYLELLPEKAQKLMNVSLSGSERLRRLVNDLLDFGKLSSGKLHFELTDSAIRPLLEEIITEQEYFLPAKQIKTTLLMPEHPVLVNTDPQRFKQILANFLSNAKKFSPANAEIVIRVLVQQDEVLINVEDHGIGIQEEFLDRLFTQFSQQMSANNREFEGSGLGLAISKSLVQSMGGKIGYKKNSPQGSIFWFTCLKAKVI